MSPAPVLCYHRIGGPLELGVTRVGRSVFARQITTLAKAGWKTLTLAEFLTPRPAPQAPRTLLITFDDGYASLAEHAFPVLADHGFTATTFVITDYVGKANDWDVRYTLRRLRHLDWPAMEHWKGRGFDFASHGASHQRLTWLPDEDVVEDLSRSRGTLMRRLGAETGRAVAYPFGAVDARIERLARSAGYEAGFGGVRGTEANRMQLPRVPVYLWDAGSIPLGLQGGAVGTAGRLVAHLANRCAVGTSIILARRRSALPPE